MGEMNKDRVEHQCKANDNRISIEMIDGKPDSIVIGHSHDKFGIGIETDYEDIKSALERSGVAFIEKVDDDDDFNANGCRNLVLVFLWVGISFGVLMFWAFFAHVN